MSRPIEFLDRASGALKQEAVYGERWLRLAYEQPIGRFLLETLVKRAFFSRLAGWKMSLPSSKASVLPFIEKYALDVSEFAAAPESYATFNDFFFRKLKPEARPIASEPGVVIFPADGRHLGFQDISACDGFFVKGQKFDVASFLGDSGLAERYKKGTLVLSRLCPVDYHRFHFPVAGTPGVARVIKGPLYSVSPIALRRRLAYLWENKRAITLVETADLGTVAIVEIGATNVGSIIQTYSPGKPVAMGDEKGFFAFGGSSTVTLFEPGKITLDADLLENSARQRELYVKMGQRMAGTEALLSGSGAGPSSGH
jgi:phosphatidylserine decarboxylase